MKSKSKKLGLLSEFSKKRLKLILEERSEDDLNRELKSLRVVAKEITKVELSDSELLRLYLDVVLFSEKVKEERLKAWDEEMKKRSFVFHNQSLHSKVDDLSKKKSPSDSS